jgi:hypothetical protein
LSKDQLSSDIDGEKSRPMSFWVLNYMITAFWLIVLLALTVFILLTLRPVLGE